MKVIRQPLVGVCLAAILGITFSSVCPAWSWLIGGWGTLILWRVFGGSVWILLAVTSVFGCLHRLQTVESQAALFSHSMPSGLWHGQGIVIQAFPSSRRTSLIVRTETLRFGKTTHPISLPILLPWRGTTPAVGTTVSWSGWMGQVKNFRSSRFNRRKVLSRKSWFASLGVYWECHKVATSQILSPPPKWHLTPLALVARKRVEEAISRGIEKNELEVAFIRALTLGATQETEKALAEIFRRTGTYHLFSVSGLHVGMVATIAWYALKISRISQPLSIPIISFLLFFYAAITGFRPPACRAAFMATILLCGIYAKRRTFILNSLATAALCMLAWNSKLLFRPGFQLSFAVVLTIALLSPPLFRLGKKICASDPFLPRSLLTRPQRLCERLGVAAAATIAVSTAAWCGSVPLLLWHFQQVSFSALLINPLVVPLAFLVLSTAIVSLICDLLIGPYLAAVFTHLNLIFASVILSLVHWAANSSIGFFRVP